MRQPIHIIAFRLHIARRSTLMKLNHLIPALFLTLAFAAFLSKNAYTQINPQNPNATCEASEAFCSSDLITFSAGTGPGSGTPAQIGPDYGCLNEQPNPAWFYMQAETDGQMIIEMSSVPSNDIDFIMWGPFDHPTEPCDGQLTGDKIVSCSYSPDPVEICTVNNAQAGEFYILMITNFSNDPCEITFEQTNVGQPGAGTSNCNIVFECSIVALTANPSACSNGFYSVSGQVSFTNPPATGVLNVKDITTGKQTNIYPPFESPENYTISSINCDGGNHTITAKFTDSLACNMNITYAAPGIPCPIGTISGGGAICDDGTAATVEIGLSDGTPPYSFQYSIDNVPQPPVMWYNGPFPYEINTFTEGWFRLDSVWDSQCSTGPIQDSVEVDFLVLPNPDIGDNETICSNDSLLLDAGAGMASYLWSTGATTQQIWVHLPATYSVTVESFDGCTNSDDMILNVIGAPEVNLGNDTAFCSGDTLLLTAPPGMKTYTWQDGSGQQTMEAFSTDMYWVEVLSYDGCTDRDEIVVTVHTTPDPQISGEDTLCIELGGGIFLYETPEVPGNNYLWEFINGIPQSPTDMFRIYLEYSVPGTDWIKVLEQSGFGCQGRDSLFIEIAPKPSPVIIYHD